MSYIQRQDVTVTTNADGNATAYSEVISGLVQSIRYVKDATTPYADTVDFTITAEATGETIWAESDVTASKTVAPRQPTHTTAGTASLYASGGPPVNDKIGLANDRFKIVIAQGGDTKTGQFHFMVA